MPRLKTVEDATKRIREVEAEAARANTRDHIMTMQEYQDLLTRTQEAGPRALTAIDESEAGDEEADGDNDNEDEDEDQEADDDNASDGAVRRACRLEPC